MVCIYPLRDTSIWRAKQGVVRYRMYTQLLLMNVVDSRCGQTHGHGKCGAREYGTASTFALAADEFAALSCAPTIRGIQPFFSCDG
jgi:hypothetical protein